MSITSSSDSDCDGSPTRKGEHANEEDQLLHAGSSALLSGSPKEAAEKYKSALDMIGGKPLKKISTAELVLRYALCVAWVQCHDYRDIHRAIDNLNELIECGHASKLPALYFALAKAYFALNRFRAALDPIGKALKCIQRISNMKQHCWPGHKQPIEETTSKESFKKSLIALQKDCGTYRPPDVMCRYEKCLSVPKDHILPSENIYFTDPDFLNFILLNCDAKCKVAYHDSCWKHLKHEMPDIDKYKDILGQPCPTENCTILDADGNATQSVVVEVKIIGQDGFDKPLKCWLLPEHARKLSNTPLKKQLKTELTSDKSSHMKDRCVSESSNGHSDKIIQNTNEDPASEVTKVSEKESSAQDLMRRDAAVDLPGSPQRAMQCPSTSVPQTVPFPHSQFTPVQPNSFDIMLHNSASHRNPHPPNMGYNNLRNSTSESTHFVQNRFPAAASSILPLGRGFQPRSNYFLQPAFRSQHAGLPLNNTPPWGWPCSNYYRQPNWTPPPAHNLSGFPPSSTPPLCFIRQAPASSTFFQPAKPQHCNTFPAVSHFGSSPSNPTYFSHPTHVKSPVDATHPEKLNSADDGFHLAVTDGCQVAPSPYVEVMVKKTSLVTAGSTLIVPIGPSGGPVKILSLSSGSCSQYNDLTRQDAYSCNNQANVREAADEEQTKDSTCHTRDKNIPSVVADSSEDVNAPIIAGNRAQDKITSTNATKSTQDKNMSSLAVNSALKESHSIRKVILEFKTLVHQLAGKESQSQTSFPLEQKTSPVCNGSSNSASDILAQNKSENMSLCRKLHQSEESLSSEEQSSEEQSSEEQSSEEQSSEEQSSEELSSDDLKRCSDIIPLAEARITSTCERLQPTMIITKTSTEEKFNETYPTLNSHEDTLSFQNLVPIAPIPFDLENTQTHSSQLLSVSSLTESSPLQAKLKLARMKEKKISSDTLTSLPSPVKRTLPKVQQEIVQEPSLEEKLASRVHGLKMARNINFGYTEDVYVNPEREYFGQPNIKDSKFVEPDVIDKVEEEYAEFVFSFYQSIFENNGPHKIEDLEERWKDDYMDLLLPQRFFEKYKSISKFLLQSQKFAAIDGLIGTSELLPAMYSKAEVELTESVSFLLFGKVQQPRSKDECTSPEFIYDSSWKHQDFESLPAQPRSCSTSSSSSSSLDADDGGLDTPTAEDSDTPAGQLVSVDDNENPVSHSYCDSPHVEESKGLSLNNSQLDASSEPFIPGNKSDNTKAEAVYMSEDDEILDGSFVELDSEDQNVWSADSRNNKNNGLHPAAVVSNEPVVRSSVRWSDGDNLSHRNAINLQYSDENCEALESIITNNEPELSTTLSDVIAELESVKTENEAMSKRLFEAEKEKSMALKKLVLLEDEIKANQAQEAQHAMLLLETKETMEQKMKCKDQECKELVCKLNIYETTSKELKQNIETLQLQANDHSSQMDKLRKDHAKELNNLIKKLKDEKHLLEKEVQEVGTEVKSLEELNIKLWKDFCDFKVKTFNQICNDRIIILNQLRDKMSDTGSPSKDEITSSVENYEELMINVARKDVEIKDIYSKEQERLNKGLHIQFPQVITLPEINSVPYPIESAINALERPTQGEFPAPRNSYSPALYNRTQGVNGSPLAPHAALRDLEALSYRPRPLTETSQMWSHSFGPQALPFLPAQQAFPSPTSMFSTSSLLPPAQVPSALSQSIAMPNMTISALSSPSSGLSMSSVPNSASSSVLNGSNSSLYYNVVGSRAPLSASHKTIPTTTQASLFMKTAASLPASAGAVMKPRAALTSPAALTPIVPTKTGIRLPLKGKSDSNYEKLMRSLQKMFPSRSEADLYQALKIAREKNNNSLSALSHSDIVAKVEEILNTNKNFKKQAVMGLEKFGQAAWGTAKPNAFEWDGADQDECIICSDALSSGQVYSLPCKHAFHTECIRKWLNTDSVCPTCRTHSTMQDEFPPLG